MSAKFTVLIVGAGRIGAFFDTPDSVDVLTHAHAFSQHPDFELLGFVDQDLARAEQAARLWSVEAYASIDEAFASARIDVVVNATPDQVHFDTLQQLIDKAPRLIFTEKPLTATLSEAKQVLAQAQTKELEIAVNYSRCFVPEFVQLRKDIMQGLHGDYLTGSGAYGKGFLHNGSHLINLLLFLLGDIKQIDQLAWQYDYSETDPSLSGIIYFGDQQPFFLQSLDSRLFTVFELDLFFTKARIRIINSGFKIEYHDITADPRFVGYKNMELAKVVETQLGQSLRYATDNLSQHLQGQTELACSLIDAYRTAEVIFKTSPQ